MRKRNNYENTGNLVVIFLVILGTRSFRSPRRVRLALGFRVPFWIIANSEKTTGFEKIAWLLTHDLFKLVCLGFYFLAPIKPKRLSDRLGHYHY